MQLDPRPPHRPSAPEGPWATWSRARLLGLALVLVAGNFAWQLLAYVLVDGLFLPVLFGVAVGVLFPVALLVKLKMWRPDRDLGLDRPHPAVLAASALLALAALAPTSLLAQVSMMLHPPDPQWATYMKDNMPQGAGQLLVAVLAVVVLAPLAEEIVFRGLIQRLATTVWGAGPAIVISSLVFGLIHGEPWYLFGLVGVGVMLAVVYEATGSVTACWLAHAVHNAVSLGMMVISGEAAADASGPTTTDLLLAGASLVVFVLLGRLLRAHAQPRDRA